jgi:hypothetical protein
MNARYLTDEPLDGYLRTRRREHVAYYREEFDLRSLLESVGWVLAGAAVGSVAVMLGAWGLTNLTDSHHLAPQFVTAMTYQSPTMPQ